VAELTDGDTLVLSLSGRDEKVRLVGIDTPETKKPGTPVECFGHEASTRLAELVPVGTDVRIERDAEARDRYGRLLAYVYRRSDNLFVNLAMVRDGYAGQLTIAPNTTYAAEFSAAEREARSDQRGLWPQCGGNHEPADG
jgi:micrococcal nuclease